MAVTTRSRRNDKPAFENSKQKSPSMQQLMASQQQFQQLIDEIAKLSKDIRKLTLNSKDKNNKKDSLEEEELTAEESAKKAADKAAKKAKERKIADWEARKRFKQEALKYYIQGSSQRQGAMDKAEHLAGLTAEGIAGEIGINLIIFCLEAFGNTPWWVQTLQLQQSLVKEIESLKTDQKRICYLPDDKGDFPEIYPADGEGKVDYSRQPLPPEEITPFAIRANGYVPQPSILEGLSIVGDHHSERMSGSNSLTPEQRARMYGIFGNESKKEDKSDPMSDVTSQNLMKPKRP